MQRHTTPFILAVIFGCLGALGIDAVEAAAQADTSAARTRAVDFVQGAFDFIENRGQWPGAARFIAAKGTMAAAFATDGFSLQARGVTGHPVAVTFAGASRAARLLGERRSPTRYHYYTGNDHQRWRADVPAYQSLLYQDLYDGIDLRVRNEAGTLEYDVLIEPGASVDQVVFRLDGVTGLKVAADGELLLQTAQGILRQTPPRTWEVLPNGARRALPAAFRVIDKTHYGFTVPKRDAKLALVVDPGLEWSTVLGGTLEDFVNGVELARDGSGDVLVTGVTSSTDFPQATFGANSLKVYVARLSGDATTLRYVTYLSGTAATGTYAGRLAADLNGDVAIVGYTNDVTFPVTANAYQPAMRGASDAYIARLNAFGALTAATFLGGSNDEAAAFTSRGIAFDPNGAIVVAGVTLSADFPTTSGAFDRTYNPTTAFATDTFIARLSPDLRQLTYSTFFATGAWIKDLVIDGAGYVTVAGETGGGLPTTAGALDRVWNNGVTGVAGEDGFLARFKLDGAGAADLKYSTYLGGHNRDEAWGLAYNPGNPELITVVGWTWQNAFARDFPTTPGAFQSEPVANWTTTATSPYVQEAFVTRFQFPASGGGSLVWSTFLGGMLWEHASDVAVDAAGNAIVLGGTRDFDFPTTRGAYDRTLGGVAGSPYDCFVSRISADGSQLLYSTLLGGSGMSTLANHSGTECEQPANNDEAHLVYAGGESVIVVGETKSPDFPTTAGVVDPTYAPGPAGFAPTRDAFIARITVTPDASGDLSVAAPTLASPANGASLPGVSNVTLSWDPVADASGIEAYNYQMSARPDFPDAFISYRGSVSGTSVPLTGVATVTWYWRVQAADRAGNLSAWSPAFTLLLGSTSAPASLASVSMSPTSVIGGSASQGTVSLSGAAPSGGAVVTLTDNAAAVSIPANVTIPAGASSTTFSATTIAVSASTTATITASYGGVNRTATLTVSPQATSGLPAPTLLSPASDARFNSGTAIQFDWTDVTGAASYTLEIDNSSTFGEPLTLRQTVSTSQFTANNLPRSRLWWRVRANSASGTAGSWSSTRRFEIR